MAPSTKKTSATRPTLLLLDGHSLAYRAFYALKEANLMTSGGTPTGAVQGFTSMLINTLRDERPTHLAVCFDVSRHTFRTDRFPDYKANRSASPDEFKGQVELIDDLLKALGITVLRKEGFEADDVIATLATRAAPTLRCARRQTRRGWTRPISASKTHSRRRSASSKLAAKLSGPRPRAKRAKGRYSPYRDAASCRSGDPEIPARRAWVARSRVIASSISRRCRSR